MKAISDLSIEELIAVIFFKKGEREYSKIDGRTRIQKLFFLLRSYFNLSQDFEYILYAYGPYSINLQNSFNILVSFDLMEERVEETQGYREYSYALKDNGVGFGNTIFNNLDNPSKTEIENIVAFILKNEKRKPSDLVEEAYHLVHERGL